jgi:hypothetical protein
MSFEGKNMKREKMQDKTEERGKRKKEEEKEK